MNLTHPIRDNKDIKKLKNYFLMREEYRNYMLITFCLNTALRISDVLNLKWSDILDGNNKIRSHVVLKEIKTGKTSEILINSSIKEAVRLYLKNCDKSRSIYLFDNGNGYHISRSQAHRIIHAGGVGAGIGNDISCHSLRKTFGYHAWKSGVPPALLMEIYNHSSYAVTKRYLGIIREDKDAVFSKILL